MSNYFDMLMWKILSRQAMSQAVSCPFKANTAMYNRVILDVKYLGVETGSNNYQPGVDPSVR